ncbi:hypothetical protein AGDE_15919 [Angomonas deanei]|uniref:Uncharacterized protein n=1 Tax=Angomonas deanei TaxID=59799 RepID=A0A7G2CK48_9TRYP|nr:hypothetical protein AGDE_15919 [Angomonas deanei]CAD2219331.1 hypothetical protein, conserved [Angomonas deanei]|eukprot:EPY18147.1 hypothetical protein AGDE_15919 [Angomonas deanei]
MLPVKLHRVKQEETHQQLPEHGMVVGGLLLVGIREEWHVGRVERTAPLAFELLGDILPGVHVGDDLLLHEVVNPQNVNRIAGEVAVHAVVHLGSLAPVLEDHRPWPGTRVGGEVAAQEEGVANPKGAKTQVKVNVEQLWTTLLMKWGHPRGLVPFGEKKRGRRRLHRFRCRATDHKALRTRAVPPQLQDVLTPNVLPYAGLHQQSVQGAHRCAQLYLDPPREEQLRLWLGHWLRDGLPVQSGNILPGGPSPRFRDLDGSGGLMLQNRHPRVGDRLQVVKRKTHPPQQFCQVAYR